jgi:hypothetical protein
LKGALANALKTNLTVIERATLEEFMNTLPEGAGAGE